MNKGTWPMPNANVTQGSVPEAWDDISQFGTAALEFPCTLAQQRYWSVDNAHPGDPTLNIAARWRLQGKIIPSLLEQALNVLVERHEALRTGFTEVDSMPVQRVTPRATLSLSLVDLASMAANERVAAVSQLASDEARRAFDLTTPPLLRATLVRLAPEQADLLITTHEMVGDCWSNGILAREMALVYEALHADQTPSLPPLEMQFGDYARWQGAWIEQGGPLTAEAYWRHRLTHLPAFHVPTDHEPPAIPAREGDIFGLPAPRELTEAAQRTATTHGATFFMLGVATLATLLHRWTGAVDVVFGTQVAGRDEMELEELIGPFVNTIVLRVDMTNDPIFADVLDQVRGSVGDALEHAVAPIERVLDMVAPVLEGQNSRRRNPLTAINFLIQRAFTRNSEHRVLSLSGVPNSSPGSRYDLNLFLVERPSGWRVSCEYDPELFGRPRIEWLVRSFVDVIC